MITFETKNAEIIFKKQLASVLAFVFKVCSCKISFFDNNKQNFNVSNIFNNENLLNSFWDKIKIQIKKDVSEDIKQKFKIEKPQTAIAVYNFLINNLN